MKGVIKKIVSVILNYLIQSEKGREYLYYVCLKEDLLKFYKEQPSFFDDSEKHLSKASKILQHKFPSSINNACVVDIGASDGRALLPVLEIIKPKKAYAFEPMQKEFKALALFAKKHEDVVIPINKALGNKTGKEIIYVTQNSGSSSLLGVEENIQDEFYKGNMEFDRKEEIEISILDNEIPDSQIVDLLKIDVQGFEKEVILGGENTLKRTKVVILEVRNHDYYKGAVQYYQIDEMMRARGFALYDILHMPSYHKMLKVHEWDAIYVNEGMGNTN